MIKKAKIWILCLLLLLSQGLKADAFIDDIIDTVVDKIDKKLTPIRIKLQDVSQTPKTVSDAPRQLRLKIMYKKEYKKYFLQAAESVFEDAFYEYLTIDEQDPEDEYRDEFLEDLDFTLETRKVKSNDSDYFQAEFISNEFVVDERIRLFFRLEQRDFMEELGFNAPTDSSFVETSIKFKAIQLKMADIVMTPIVSLADKSIDSFEAQNIQATVDSYVDLATTVNTEDIEFEYIKNSKRLKASAKRKAKKVKLLPLHTVDSVGINKSGPGQYQLSLPLRLQPGNLNKRNFFKESKKFTVKIPIIIRTFTDTGLDVRIKGVAKAKILAI